MMNKLSRAFGGFKRDCRALAADYAAMIARKNAPRWIKQLTAIGKWPSHSAPAAISAH